jgi:hypothetical protein
VADERTQLVGWLDQQRALVPWKCEGLSEADAHRPVLPSSPLMTMAGIVSHLRWTEHCWFEVLFLGRPAVGPQFDDGPQDADMRVEGVPLAQLLDEYARQCALSNETVAAHSLLVGRHPTTGQAPVRCAGCSSTCSRRLPGTSATWTPCGSSSTGGRVTADLRARGRPHRTPMSTDAR